MSEIKVKVTKNGGCKYLYMYYDCPITGKREQRSTRKTRKRDADREAGKWEAELREGRYRKAGKIGWEEFRMRYEDEVLASLADKTDSTVGTVFNSIERIISPLRLADLTAERLSHYQAELRSGHGRLDKDGKRIPRSEHTVRTYLAHLMSALKWAVDQGLLVILPKVKMPQRAKSSKSMKGRPIKGEEYDRMIARTAGRVGDSSAASWKHYLEGLWLSGLRLGESLGLWWDRDDKITFDFSGKRPLFKIPAHLNKSGVIQVTPMTPDFYEFAMKTPQSEQRGPVFVLGAVNGKGTVNDRDWVSTIVREIGRAAGIIVHTYPSGKIKYASAHDLRRSFGERWARRVMPVVLQALMRHERIETTMKYYVGQNAEASADAAWEAVGVTTLVTTDPNGVSSQRMKKAAKH